MIAAEWIANWHIAESWSDEDQRDSACEHCPRDLGFGCKTHNIRHMRCFHAHNVRPFFRQIKGLIGCSSFPVRRSRAFIQKVYAEIFRQKMSSHEFWQARDLSRTITQQVQ